MTSASESPSSRFTEAACAGDVTTLRQVLAEDATVVWHTAAGDDVADVDRELDRWAAFGAGITDAHLVDVRGMVVDIGGVESVRITATGADGAPFRLPLWQVFTMVDGLVTRIDRWTGNGFGGVDQFCALTGEPSLAASVYTGPDALDVGSRFEASNYTDDLPYVRSLYTEDGVNITHRLAGPFVRTADDMLDWRHRTHEFLRDFRWVDVYKQRLDTGYGQMMLVRSVTAKEQDVHLPISIVCALESGTGRVRRIDQFNAAASEEAARIGPALFPEREFAE
jgi:hypothetical protein